MLGILLSVYPELFLSIPMAILEDKWLNLEDKLAKFSR